MRKLLSVLLALSLVGCASVQLPIADIESSAEIAVVDLRPSEEGIRESFSLLITSERYGYARLSQDLTTPNGPRLFAHRLMEKYGVMEVPPTKLHHFVVYMNARSELRTNAVAAGFGGAIGAAIAAGTVTRDGEVSHTLVNPAEFDLLSGEDEYKRAIYTDSELPDGASAYIVYIESETAGMRRFTRTVAPMRHAETHPVHAALEAAIEFHLNH